MAALSKLSEKQKFILLITVAAVCLALGLYFDVDVAYYRDLIKSFPIYVSGFFFVALYVAATTVLWIGPKDILRLSAAVLFGAYASTAFVFVSEMINAAIMFSLSRRFGQEYVQKKFNVKRKHVDQARDNAGSIGVFALRINLLLPLRFIDLGYGLTRYDLGRYLAASILPTFMRIFIQQYMFAELGAAVLADPTSLVQFIGQDSTLLVLCAIYIVAWVISTIIALRIKAKRLPA